MALIDELKQMKRKGRYVVSLTHVIERLESIEINDCPNCAQIPVYNMDSFPRASQDVKEVI